MEGGHSPSSQDSTPRNRKQSLEQVGMSWDGVNEGEFANELEQLGQL